MVCGRRRAKPQKTVLAYPCCRRVCEQQYCVGCGVFSQQERSDSGADGLPAFCRSFVWLRSAVPAGPDQQGLQFFLPCPKDLRDAHTPAANNYICICFEPCFIFIPPIPRPLRTSGVISAYCIMAPPDSWWNFLAAPLSAKGISSLPMGPIMSLPTT